MNFEKFRRTGELSDIAVIVDKTEFKLHTFPLFTKSEFFKKALATPPTSLPYVIRLDNEFPGGAQIFNQLADYFYSIPLAIDQKNIVALRSAACFVQSEELSSLLDKRIDELLRLARARNDLSIPLLLLEQSTGEFQPWAKEIHLIDKCLQSIVDSLTRGTSLQLNKTDRDILIRLPVEWIVQLIDLCSNDGKVAVLPLAKHYLTVLVLDSSSTPTNSVLSTQNETNHQSAFTPVPRKDESPALANNEKRSILDQIVKALGNTIGQYPTSWLHTVYEKSVELQCECQSTLSSYMTQAILHSTDIHDGVDNLPDDVMTTLLDQISKHREAHVKDPQLLAKLATLIDAYVEQLRQRGTLTSEQFLKLASCIPKDQRASHDSLLLALNELFKHEKSNQLTESEREQLINQIDFSRVNEETISLCKNNKLIPQKLITEAALSLCVKLRKQLDDVRNRVRSAEQELGTSRPNYPTTSTYRTRHIDSLSPSRVSSNRSRHTYSSNYEVPMSTSAYSYSKYDNDIDLDHLLPSRYLSSSVLGRYGSSYYTYRY